MSNRKPEKPDTTTAIEKRDQPATVNVPDRLEPSPAYYTPLVDVAETADGFVFHADLPGAKADDVDVSFDTNTLTIEARVHPRQPAGQTYTWYGVGHFYRQFTIQTPVIPDAIRAKLHDGVLELHVPKADSAKPKKIQIAQA